ncbi:Fc.00g035100.m01.CDS01 [Cosmosporella sp. VM-42]
MTPSILPRPSRVFPRSLSRANPAQPEAKLARGAEYQAIWQLFARCSMKEAYQRASIANRRSMLKDASRVLLNKRRRQGRTMCNANIDELINRQMKKERDSRTHKRRSAPAISPQEPQGGLSTPGRDNHENHNQGEPSFAQKSASISSAKGKAKGFTPLENMNGYPPPSPLNIPGHEMAQDEMNQNDEGGQDVVGEGVLKCLQNFVEKLNLQKPPDQVNINPDSIPTLVGPQLYELEEQVAEQVEALRAENDELQANNVYLQNDINSQYDDITDLNEKVRELQEHIAGMRQHMGRQITELRTAVQWLLDLNKPKGQPQAEPQTNQAQANDTP